MSECKCDFICNCPCFCIGCYPELGQPKRRCLKEIYKTLFRDHKEISEDDQVVWEWWEEERFERKIISIANYQEKVEGHVKPESKFEAALIKAIESMFYFSAKE